MELPDDVLRIIKAYSMPLMQFSGEYKKCLKRLDPYFTEMNDWNVRIKKLLCDKDADKVIEGVKDFVDARLASCKATIMVHRAQVVMWKEEEKNELTVQGTVCAEVLYRNTLRLLDLLYKSESNMLEKEKKTAHVKRFAMFGPCPP